MKPAMKAAVVGVVQLHTISMARTKCRGWVGIVIAKWVNEELCSMPYSD